MDIGLISIFLLSAVGVLGDFFLDLAGKTKHGVIFHWFVMGMLIYALSAFGWFYVIKQTKLEDLGVLYATATSILLVLLGVFVFKEQLEPKEILGILFGLLSIILLSRFH